MPQYPPPASSRGILGDYVIVHGKIKCPTLGPASPVKTPWYPLVLYGRGIVGHTIDRPVHNIKHTTKVTKFNGL